jgi:2-desacetyl-2-hydroxyethyl bacteriochlorophyllide A dehydrogenase
MPDEPLLARALWFSSPNSAEVREHEVPPPGPGEVRVRAIVSAISHGTEMLVYRGQVAPDLPLDLPTLEGSFAFPIKYGYAAVGRVLDTGDGVKCPHPGDAVFVHHPHQSVFDVPAGMPVVLPENLDPTLGVFAANVETALNIVHDTPLLLGETAAVFGQGVVGLLVTQLLRLAGAGRVLAVEPRKSRRDLSLRLGADAALVPGENIVEANGGRRPDVAVEVSGSGAALSAAIDSVADEGTVVAASWYGTKPVMLDLGGRFHRGRVRVRSSQVGGIGPERAPRWDRGRRMEAVIRLLGRLRLKELISHRFRLDDAPEVYRLLDRDGEDVVQAVFVYDDEGG